MPRRATTTFRSAPSAVQKTPVAVDQSKSIQVTKTAHGANIHWPIKVMLLIHAAGCVAAVYFIGRQYRLLRKLVGNSTVAPTEITQLTQGAAQTLGMKSVPRVLVSEESDAPWIDSRQVCQDRKGERPIREHLAHERVASNEAVRKLGHVLVPVVVTRCQAPTRASAVLEGD